MEKYCGVLFVRCLNQHSLKVGDSSPKNRKATALPVTAVRLDPQLLELVDEWAEKSDINRSEAIRRLVELVLKGPRQPK